MGYSSCWLNISERCSDFVWLHQGCFEHCKHLVFEHKKLIS